MKKILLFVCAMIICSCDKNNDSILSNNQFDRLYRRAVSEGRPFCIILANTDSIDVESIAQEYDQYKNSLILKIINVSKEENEWCLKWLGNRTVPQACLFTDKGDLVDIIIGIPEFDIIMDLLHKGPDSKMSERIVTLGQILKNQMYIEMGADIGVDVEKTAQYVQCPYVYYQNLICSILSGDSLRVESAAYALLDFEDIEQYASLYNDEFRIAHNILNDKSHEGPLLNSSICEIAQKGKYQSFSIKLENPGNEPLFISRITVGCNCIDFMHENNTIKIDQNKNMLLKFRAELEKTDSIEKVIYFFSNAVNSPVKRIVIQ